MYAETCAQYLVLDDSAFDGPDGHLFACCPQIKKKKDQERLWKGLHEGEVSVVSTDTCTFTRAQKAALGGRLDQDPDGAAGAGDAAADRLYPRRARRAAHSGGICRQVLHQSGQAHGPLSAKGRHRAREATPTWRSSTPHKRIEVDCADDGDRRRLEPLPGLVAGGFRRDHVLPRTEDRRRLQFIGESGWGRWLPRERAGSLDDREPAAISP